MKKYDVIKHFGSQTKTATALGCTSQNVNMWRPIIPEVAALKLQSITKGKLKYDPKLYEKKEKNNVTS